MSSEVTQGQLPDVYGQVHPVETPELIQEKLMALHKELAQLPEEKTKAWKQAQEQCPLLVDEDFELQFLRCEVFNADLAAKRLVKYWKKRVEIFGPKAFAPLTQDNLLAAVGGEDDEDGSTTNGNAVALGLGVMTLLPQTDPSGRSIVYWDPSHLDSSKYPVEAMIRAFWYVLHAALEPISAQQHGIVVVVDPQRCALSQVADASLSKLIGGAMSGVLPLRLSGIHIVHPPFFVNMVLPVIKVFMPARMQQRIQFHSGTSRDVIDTLQTDYGIPVSCLPTLMGGLWKLDHSGWLRSRREEGK